MVHRGPGDYLVATPDYPLADKAAAPEIEHLFGRILGLGQLRRSPLQFQFTPAGCLSLWSKVPDRQPRLLFGHADAPESLEAMTLKAAWLDECGQAKFKLGSWEAIQRRLAIDEGRVLLTSTPYTMGWLKQIVWDPWEAVNRQHPEIDLVNFNSLMNPAFPRAEFDRARAALPCWKFDMFYRGIFTRPAGLIYDCFDNLRNCCPRFAIPSSWPRYLGLDFGGVNTAGVFVAENPADGKLYACREYLAGSRTAAEHVIELLKGEPGLPIAAGGAKSEQQWRDEFRRGGLSVREPAVSEVEVGIDRVYAALREGRLVVFDDLAALLDEFGSYSRVVDDVGNPTEEIDDKSSYHRLDAMRYLISTLGMGRWGTQSEADRDSRSLVGDAPPGVFLS